jgi:hypothetical protein
LALFQDPYKPGGAVGHPARPRLIHLSVRESVSHITFNYSAENGLGLTELVNKYVKIVNRWGIASQIFFKINFYIVRAGRAKKYHPRLYFQF